MTRTNKEQDSNTSKVENSEKNITSESRNSLGTVSDYISGDSTPSSSSHQFPRIATDPKHESKKSAMKTNS